MWFNRDKFANKCNEILDDIESGKFRSSAWFSMGIGMIGGLVLSCMKLRRKTGKPILANFKKVEKTRKEEPMGRF